MSGAAGGGGGSGAVVRQGHLRKLKTMKKKFFVLRSETTDYSARLEYYESEKKFRAGASPRRVLSLKSCYNITRRLDLKQKHVIALFTKEEQFCIVAENEQDLHGWLAAMLKLHGSEDASEELLHPIQHVWQVNVQKKGLGAVKNIHGLYNLCLTDKTLTLVKIKSHNNVISELGIPERIEYSLKNIRRCGDSECFFYMEVGRQTTTGAGELWMHSDDSNISQSMHSTIYHAMRSCAKETENERDHIVIPKNEGGLGPRRQTYSDDGRGRAGLIGEKALCVGACIRQCVCASATLSIDDSAADGAGARHALAHAEYQAHNPLTDKPKRVIKHQRTVSLPTGCPTFQEPLKIVHGRTRSEPLTGEEVDRVVEKGLHSSCKAVNGTGTELPKGQVAPGRRASTGMRLSKLSPAHSKNHTAGPQRSRCVSMPSTRGSSFDSERPPPRHNDIEGADASRDETDSVGEWYRTPRIPEEPDVCDLSKDLFNISIRSGSIQHSRTSSMGVDDANDSEEYLDMVSTSMATGASTNLHEIVPMAVPDGYLPMGPGLDPMGGLISASSGSVCSGTPSTDPRFSEYQLEPATSHIGSECRPPRAYSVGSRPAPRAETRHRTYSVGARARPPPPHRTATAPNPTTPNPSTAHHARASAEDLMMLDFTVKDFNKSMPIVSRTPPHGTQVGGLGRSGGGDEYVDMSPRNLGYVEMRPGEHVHAPLPPTPSGGGGGAGAADGYVEMTYGGAAATRPISISAARSAPPPPPPPAHHSPDDKLGSKHEPRAAHGSQIFEFSGSLESPLSPAEDTAELDDEPHPAPQTLPLPTVREGTEDAPRPRTDNSAPRAAPVGIAVGGRAGADAEAAGCVSCSPQYVTLKPGLGSTTPEPLPLDHGNPTANKCLARLDSHDTRVDSASSATVVLASGASGAAARFSVGGAPPSPSFTCAPLNYAALDLEPRRNPPHPAKRTYTQIDFVRSEKLHAADGT